VIDFTVGGRCSIVSQYGNKTSNHMDATRPLQNPRGRGPRARTGAERTRAGPGRPARWSRPPATPAPSAGARRLDGNAGVAHQAPDADRAQMLGGEQEERQDRVGLLGDLVAVRGVPLGLEDAVHQLDVGLLGA